MSGHKCSGGYNLPQRHVHLAQEGTSLCGRCGRDIRHEVHLRWGEPIPLTPADTPADTVESLRAQRDALAEALSWFVSMTAESEGIAGYHLNGAVAAWGEFEEVAAAEAALAAAGRR